MKNRDRYLVVLFFLPIGFLFGEFPLIRNLNLTDPLFRQHQEDVAQAYKSFKQRLPSPPLILFRYKARTEDTIFSLSARFNLPFETIGTLNSIDSSVHPLENRTLLIPNQPGLFLAENPVSEMERIIRSWRNLEGLPLNVQGRKLRFLANERFHTIERSYFLRILFTFPIKQGILTSSFGNRISPITGQPHFHSGIDLAAPIGTPVFAARDGRVVESGVDPILGIYLIIDHPGNFQTVYGHLSASTVELNQSVNAGMIVGYVGTTGASTGPHLHFEIRQRGRPMDPARLLPNRMEARR